MKVPLVSLSLYLQALAFACFVQADDTCLFNNQVFQRGESYGDSFTSRCGSADEFPCHCNPDLTPPIECNYCSYALQGGGLLCARNDEILSFTDIRGDDQTCYCSATQGSVPSANCDLNVNNAFCFFDLPDGTQKIFADGNPIDEDLLQNINRCGPDFPCLCSNGQIECPYCTFQDKNNDLICAKDGETTVAFQDDQTGDFQACTCQISSNGAASSQCVSTTGPPTVSPTNYPALGCPVTNANGDRIIIEYGDSFGSLVEEGVCGSSDDWPHYCNVGVGAGNPSISRSIGDNVDYPYCIFENTYSGEVICARNMEVVTFLDDSGFDLRCTCVVLRNELGGPTSKCYKAEPTSSPTLSASPTTSPADPGIASAAPTRIWKQFVYLSIALGVVLNSPVIF